MQAHSGEPIRRIAHLDMDAFYASVELLRYPQLKDQPVVIGAGRRAIQQALETLRAEDLRNLDPAEPAPPWDEAAQRAALRRIPLEAFDRLANYVGRGVITTATYAARQFGVGSAMGMMKAAKLCPQAILLPVDFDEYRKYSRQFKSTITGIAPLIGLIGTVSGLIHVFASLGLSAGAADAKRIALGISEALTCTIFGLGIAVPALVAFVYFSKKVEVMSVEMESLITDLLSKLYFGRIAG